jgi:hypothetical protein
MRSISLVLGVLLAACGGGGVSSGVDGNKPAATVTNDEARRSCMAAQDYFYSLLPRERQQEGLCTGQALTTTITPEACSASVRTCMTNPPAALDLVCNIRVAPAGCNATVAQVEACAAADAQAIADRAAMLSCSIAGNLAQLQVVASPIPVPMACTSIAAICPPFGRGYFQMR